MAKLWQRTYDNEAYQYDDPPVYENESNINDLKQQKQRFTRKKISIIAGIAVAILVIIIIIVVVVIATEDDGFKCKKPEQHPHTIIHPNNKQGKGTKITYYCNGGERIDGDYERICLADGTWTHEALRCSVPCDKREVQTTGGNGGGANCVFPFKYKNGTVNSCISTNHNATWCSTTPDYDEDQEWGDCLIPTEQDPDVFCHFPFIYNGLEYNGCQAKSGPGNNYWCGTQYYTNSTMTYCEQLNEECPIFDAETASEYCAPVLVTGGTAKYHDECVFPFLWQNNTYDKCISFGHDRPWCATSYNYDTDELWGNCNLGATDGEGDCYFPFIYNGRNFTDCTVYDAQTGKYWCGLDAMTSTWGYCYETDACPFQSTGAEGVIIDGNGRK